jgi:hypothetical protein
VRSWIEISVALQQRLNPYKIVISLREATVDTHEGEILNGALPWQFKACRVGAAWYGSRTGVSSSYDLKAQVADN